MSCPAPFRVLPPLAAALALAGLMPSIADAEVNVSPQLQAALGGAPNEAAVPVVDVIGRVCPNLSPSDPNPETRRFQQSCTRLVVTTLGVSQHPLNLGIGTEELASAFLSMGPEEMTAQTRIQEALSPTPIGARLLALRSGARGLTVSDLSLNQGGRRVSLAGLLPKEMRGGGAAADTARWGGFLNAAVNWGDRGASPREDAFDFDNASVVGGVDYRITDSLAVGVALSWDKTDVDFDNDLGNVDAKSRGVSVYGTWSAGNFYVDAQVSRTRTDFDTVRNISIRSLTSAPAINTQATSSTDGTQTSASIGGGMNMAMGRATVSPYARLEWLRMKVDPITESEPLHGLALAVEGRTVRSLQSALGARASMTFSTGFGVLMPHAGVEWNHEFRNNTPSTVARFLADPFNTFFVIPTDEPDRNFFTLSAGLSAQFARGVSGFVNLDSTQGLRRTDHTALTAGVKIEF